MKTPSTNELISIAEAAGVHVTWHKGGPKGAWFPHKRRISLRHGMDDASTRCTMAHELAHMWLGHPAPASDRQERRADDFAARLLISETDYANIESVYGHYPQQIAAELNVTTHILATWRDTYERQKQ